MYSEMTINRNIAFLSFDWLLATIPKHQNQVILFEQGTLRGSITVVDLLVDWF